MVRIAVFVAYHLHAADPSYGCHPATFSINWFTDFVTVITLIFILLLNTKWRFYYLF